MSDTFEATKNLSDEHKREVIQIAEDTGSDYGMARQALETCDWDLAEAVKMLSA